MWVLQPVPAQSWGSSWWALPLWLSSVWQGRLLSSRTALSPSACTSLSLVLVTPFDSHKRLGRR